MSNTLSEKYDFATLSIEERLMRVKETQDQIVTRANENDFLKEFFYFGTMRTVVDETKFVNEILGLRELLKTVKFSDFLHQKFSAARESLVKICQSQELPIADSILEFKNLSEEDRLDLARRIINHFNKIFFGKDYKYVNPVLEYDPESNRSFNRNYKYKENQKEPTASMVRLSNSVIGNGDINIFLNLIFHEGCVHSVMYQLEQSYGCRWIDNKDPLYEDAKKRYLIKKDNIFASFEISSIYPNFMEEAIAFKQSAEFVHALGYKPLGIEDEIILSSTNPHWPYGHKKLTQHVLKNQAH